MLFILIPIFAVWGILVSETPNVKPVIPDAYKVNKHLVRIDEAKF